MARPHTGDPILAARVRKRRKELGWNRKKLAREAGRSLDWVIGLEGAKNATTIAGLYKLREILARPIGWLFGELPEELPGDLLEVLASLQPGSEELEDISDLLTMVAARAQRRQMKESRAAGGESVEDDREEPA